MAVRRAAFAFAPLSVFAGSGWAQGDSSTATCSAAVKPPFCSGLRGDRAEGWLQQSRSEVMARHGMVATSQPLAAQAGLRILMQGGNAIDAAVATTAVLSLVEPMMVGPAGDLFAFIYISKERKLYVLNASGKAPSGATIERFAELGYQRNPQNWGPGSGMPVFGILPVTVPGSVWGWEEVLKRFGKLTFKEVLQPAIDYAENGFPVSERIASDWRMPNALPLRKCCTEPDPDSIKAWYIDGKPPVAGQIFRNPDLAKTSRLLSKEHAETLCGKVSAERASATGPAGKADGTGDTIVLSAADGEGNMVSWVNSNYAGFGSGITVPGYGMILHNRGALFSLDPKSPNAIAPHKRPFNTLSAGFVIHKGEPLMTVTLTGGDMQAQGHAQMLVSIIDLGANLQAAADLARFRHAQVPNVLYLESALHDRVGAQLKAMGHAVRSIDGGQVGGVQTIMVNPNGGYRGASDFRKDGQAVGW